MGVIFQDLLAMDCLKEATILAGENCLTNEVKYVDILEVPDIIKWLKSGVFLLTTAYAIKDDLKAQLELIQELKKKKAAGLGLKLGRFIDALPAEVMELADRLGVPIIGIPKEIPYVDIIMPVSNLILDHQENVLKRSEEIHRKLTEVVLKGGEYRGIAENLQQITKKPVIIVIQGQVLERVGVSEKLMNAIPINQDKGIYTSKFIPKAGNISGHIVAPIVSDEIRYGEIIIITGKKEPEKIDFIAAEHGATVAALEVMKEKAVTETEVKLKGDILEDLLRKTYQSEKAIIRRAGFLGWDLTCDYLIAIFDIDNLENYYMNIETQNEGVIQDFKKKLRDIPQEVFRESGIFPILVGRSDSIVIMIPAADKKPTTEWQNNILTEIKRRLGDVKKELSVSCGIGRLHRGIEGIQKGYYEARAALATGRKVWGKNGIYAFEDLGVYRLILKMKEDPELESFCLEKLRPILEYDREKGGELLNTMKTYLFCRGNKKETAKALFIHRNTLDYRLRKINELLGERIDLSSHWLDYELSLKILQVIKD